MASLHQLAVLATAAIVGSSSSVVAASPEQQDTPWHVQNCIVVSMEGEFTVFPLEKNSTYKINVPVPLDATVSGDCKKLNQSQTISLNWKENMTDVEDTLNRNITVIFKRNDTANPPYYGVYKISGVYEIDKEVKNETDDNGTVIGNTTITHYLSFGTYGLNPYEFQTPINRSYLCLDLGTMSMAAELHDSTEPGGDSGEKLNNVTFTARRVQFDAFRSANISMNVFQESLDCSYKPSDVVPIVVGCALAGTVLLVLIAYLVGRRRNRARGYQSV